MSTLDLLDAGVMAAEQVLADRRQFTLDEARWQAFQEALDRPVQTRLRLKKLLSRRNHEASDRNTNV